MLTQPVCISESDIFWKMLYVNCAARKAIYCCWMLKGGGGVPCVPHLGMRHIFNSLLNGVLHVWLP